MRRWVAVTALVVVAAAAGGQPAAAQAPPAAASIQALRDEAFELAYNLDHEPAVALLDRALALDPGDAGTHRAIAAITWLNILFQRGAITVDHYLGSMSRPRVDVARPPAELDREFRTHVARAVSLARDRVAREPRNPQAHYDLGSALGLEASYVASIEGRLMAGFRAARGAFDAHERVMELDRSRADAGLIVGTYRYLVATLSLPMRWMAYIAGFGGGKERGIRFLEGAAAYPGDSQTEARFALILIYNRERRYDEALRVIRELQARFPRNRLLGLELAATALRAGRAEVAEKALSAGLGQLAADPRPRAGAEVSMWHYKRGAARVRLNALDAASEDLRAALGAGPPTWIRGRATVELGKIADLRGDRGRAQSRYREAVRLCERDRDPLCVNEAQRLVKRRYVR